LHTLQKTSLPVMGLMTIHELSQFDDACAACSNARLADAADAAVLSMAAFATVTAGSTN